MKKNEIKVGGVYVAKVSDKLVTVRIDSTHSRGGWNATNTATGRAIRIKSAQRLRRPAKGRKTSGEAAEPTAETVAEWRADGGDAHLGEESMPEVPGEAKDKTKANGKGKAATKKAKAKKANGEPKPKRVSALDAAAQVLAKAGKPMRAQELIAAMAEQGLWTSPNGRTPHATLYAAMLREVAAKGKDARFAKVDRGQFAFAGKEA